MTDDGFLANIGLVFSIDVGLRYFSTDVNKVYFWSKLVNDVFSPTLPRAFFSQCHQGYFLADND